MAEEIPARSRGTLVIADRVVQRLAERAALNVDAVVRQQGTVGTVLGSSTTDLLGIGNDLPAASVDAAGNARRLSLTLALEWPCPVTRVCQEVRAAVADELEEYTGDRPLCVDVTVRRLVPRGEVARRKQGYIDLPPVSEADPIDDSPDGEATAAEASEDFNDRDN